jgi:hypothetical protein
VLSPTITYIQPADPLIPTDTVTEVTQPVPVGCVPLAVIHPPLKGHGWFAESGCCTYAVYHRPTVNAVNGELFTSEQFAIDFMLLGPNHSVLSKPISQPPSAKDVTSYWAYGMPVLAVAKGVVTEVVNTFSDSVPTVNPNIGGEGAPGNHVILDIGNGRYVAYAHLMLNSIKVVVGQRVQVGEQIANLGNTGNSFEPHLHFQLMNRSSFPQSHGLPFVFDTQLLEGRISEADTDKLDLGMVVPIDRTGAGTKRNLMPERNGVFGFNLSR